MTTPRQLPLSPATRAAQALRHIDPMTGSITPPLDLSSTFARDDAYAPRQPYIYAREGGPTVAHAEAVLADLDGAAASLAFASGMSAFVALTETLRSGDHVVCPSIMYHGGLTWLRRLEERRGIALATFDPADPAALAKAIRPGHPPGLDRGPDQPDLGRHRHRRRGAAAHAAGALLAADCTAAPPCTLRALELGADIAFHSGTKYLGGHSDLTAGVLSFARRDDFFSEINTLRTLMGGIIKAFEAWLLIRGLRTLFLRYERASASALAIARHFEHHPRRRARPLPRPPLAPRPRHRRSAR